MKKLSYMSYGMQRNPPRHTPFFCLYCYSKWRLPQDNQWMYCFIHVVVLWDDYETNFILFFYHRMKNNLKMSKIYSTESPDSPSRWRGNFYAQCLLLWYYFQYSKTYLILPMCMLLFYVEFIHNYLFQFNCYNKLAKYLKCNIFNQTWKNSTTAVRRSNYTWIKTIIQLLRF